MWKIFQFLVMFGLFWCFVSSEGSEEENAEPSADADPADPAEPVTINIGAYCVIWWTDLLATKFCEKIAKIQKWPHSFKKKKQRNMWKFIHIDICTVNVLSQQSLLSSRLQCGVSLFIDRQNEMPQAASKISVWSSAVYY